MRRGWIAAAVTAAAVLAAGPVQASVTWETGDTLYYVAAPGEPNALNVNLQGPDATVQDAGYPAIGMVEPCRPWEDLMLDGTGAFCPAWPVSRVVVDLGDGADSLSAGAMTGQPLPAVAFGGHGNDRLWSWVGHDELIGGPGQDLLTSSGGNDLLDARDGAPDTVECGDGDDIAVVDAVDAVSECETTLSERPADRPAPAVPAAPQPTIIARHPTRTPATAPVAPPPPPAGEPVVRPPDVHLRLVVSAVRLGKARSAGLPVRASCGAGCRVRAVVRVARARARRLRVPRTLARAARTSTASGTARLRMRLRGAGLRKVRRLRITVHAEAVTAAGQRLVQDVVVTLRR